MTNNSLDTNVVYTVTNMAPGGSGVNGSVHVNGEDNRKLLLNGNNNLNGKHQKVRRSS